MLGKRPEYDFHASKGRDEAGEAKLGQDAMGDLVSGRGPEAAGARGFRGCGRGIHRADGGGVAGSDGSREIGVAAGSGAGRPWSKWADWRDGAGADCGGKFAGTGRCTTWVSEYFEEAASGCRSGAAGRVGSGAREAIDGRKD